LKEVERMKEENKRREKQHQEKLNQMNCKYSVILEAAIKLGEESRKHKSDFKKAHE